MKTTYYEMYDDVYIPERWHLSTPREANGATLMPARFERGQRLNFKDEPVVPLSRAGRALDFDRVGLAISLVSQRFVSLCERLGLQDQVQFIQARVEGHAEPYFLLNTLRVLRCIDDARCEEVQRWKKEDGHPELVEEYRNIWGLKIDPTKVGDAHLFRPWGWTVALLVSEHLKRAIEDAGLTGPKFLEV